MGTTHFKKAKEEKYDEFYTQYADIQKEIEAYLAYNPAVFRGKVLYCNCDDPHESNFFRYFVLNFNRIGLKQLVASNYNLSSVANTQLELFDDNETDKPVKGRSKVTANRFIINDVDDLHDEVDVDSKDIALRLQANKNNECRPLNGDGDFRSAECIELLKQADIVATNPPFSLFREYVRQLVYYQKQFVIIGPLGAISYKEIFPLIKDNKLWLGATHFNEGMYFQVPDDFVHADAYTSQKEIDGEKVGRVSGICWFTSLDHGHRHQPLRLMPMASNKKLQKSETAYQQYDNYDAIEVPSTKAIPSDYDGVMGVPISFLGKYNPEQFEILGSSQRGCHSEVPDTRKYDDFWEVRQNGEQTGSSGGKTNENPNLAGNDGKKNYFINRDGDVIQSAYQRIFIRHKGKGHRGDAKQPRRA